MFISNLFIKHKTPQPRFAPGLFVGLMFLFMAAGSVKPLVGLVGIGTVSVIGASLVLLNRQRIWDNYRKGYKKQKGLKGMMTRPSETYYNINVGLLWPLILLMGLLCLAAAYRLA